MFLNPAYYSHTHIMPPKDSFPKNYQLVNKWQILKWVFPQDSSTTVPKVGLSLPRPLFGVPEYSDSGTTLCDLATDSGDWEFLTDAGSTENNDTEQARQAHQENFREARAQLFRSYQKSRKKEQAELNRKLADAQKRLRSRQE
ncbi:hypothetical protein CC78DRAFT_565148 [Lojkania enalia]|uniref:Uncharacterized protein n=1 Tax=Lojkania enalia TaxID=147567 RepID=A0A9P4N9G1_9PLEO|nr:hypothetical protein CC78DRAFT_565148 [Didymosphaeria enalia]